MTLITKNSISYLSSESYQDAKRWNSSEPAHINIIVAVMILGTIAIVTLYSSALK
jgi:hypothetical protein